jgi:hypothetical protein
MAARAPKVKIADWQQHPQGTRSACNDRISLYPVAPFRLATSLHALTIAQSHRDFAA